MTRWLIALLLLGALIASGLALMHSGIYGLALFRGRSRGSRRIGLLGVSGSRPQGRSQVGRRGHRVHCHMFAVHFRKRRHDLHRDELAPYLTAWSVRGASWFISPSRRNATARGGMAMLLLMPASLAYDTHAQPPVYAVTTSIRDRCDARPSLESHHSHLSPPSRPRKSGTSALASRTLPAPALKAPAPARRATANSPPDPSSNRSKSGMRPANFASASPRTSCAHARMEPLRRNLAQTFARLPDFARRRVPPHCAPRQSHPPRRHQLVSARPVARAILAMVVRRARASHSSARVPPNQGTEQSTP